MDPISCVMIVRIPTTVNNHTLYIQKDNICNLCFQTNSHGLRKTATHVYSYHLSSVLVIFMYAMTSNQLKTLFTE